MVEQKRIVMRVELYPAAKESLEQLANQLGMKQVATGERLIEWFTQQDASVQALTMNLIPDPIAPGVARLLLRRRGASE